MPDDEYFTTDTKSVAPEIDVSDIGTRSDDDRNGRRLAWKRPVAYLLVVLVLVTLIAWSLGGSGPPLPP